MSSNINLGSQLESYVAGLVRSGRFASRDDVLREGVRLLEEREKRLAVLDGAIARGLADADAGQVVSARDVAVRLRAKYQAMGAGKAQ